MREFRWYRRLEYGLIQITESDSTSVSSDVHADVSSSQLALAISNAQGIHGGLYVCNASNALGSDTMEVRVKLIK
jgi:Immunoglobulin I-set domain